MSKSSPRKRFYQVLAGLNLANTAFVLVMFPSNPGWLLTLCVGVWCLIWAGEEKAK